MFKYYNSNLIISNRCYSTEKIQKLLSIHPQTLRSWCNEGGLICISKKPISIYGAVLKEFIKNRNESHKKTLEFNQMKCFKCKAISIPQDNKIAIYHNKNGSIRAVAIECCCENVELSKLYKKIDAEKLKQVFFIKPTELTLCNSISISSNTHIEIQKEVVSNESKNITNIKNTTTKNNLSSNTHIKEIKTSSKTNIEIQKGLFDFDL